MASKTQNDVPPLATGEFLRALTVPNGPTTYIIDPSALAPDPFAFGIALVDCVRRGARPWADATGVDETTVCGRIWEGIDAERARPTTELN